MKAGFQRIFGKTNNPANGGGEEGLPLVIPENDPSKLK